MTIVCPQAVGFPQQCITLTHRLLVNVVGASWNNSRSSLILRCQCHGAVSTTATVAEPAAPKRRDEPVGPRSEGHALYYGNVPKRTTTVQSTVTRTETRRVTSTQAVTLHEVTEMSTSIITTATTLLQRTARCKILKNGSKTILNRSSFFIKPMGRAAGFLASTEISTILCIHVSTAAAVAVRGFHVSRP